jgi:DNA-binding GntR family transcriptional regulator
VLRIFVDTVSAIAGDALPAVEWTPERRATVADTHERVIAALERRDGDLAERIMSDHVREATAFWQATYSDVLDRPVRWAG